ncbi:MAG: GDSL-type esterase/lipase family protein [Clostridium sp.]|uniref:GDSL-type esterase/lipase family protein n=1 Tax=Clostridium sp. TaxID=1506 RepID=UPI003D6D82A5
MKKVLSVITILLITVGIFAIGVGVKRANKNQKSLAVSSKQRREESVTIDAKAANLNFYENLSENRDVKALIIGDSMSQSNGSSSDDKKWYNLLIKDVKSKYKSTMTTDLITGDSTTAVRAGVELNKTKLTKEYDVAFLCFGQNDQWSLSPKQFGTYYESIIINLKKTNPNIEIIPIIESSFREYNSYSDIIIALSKNYNFQQADMVLAFNNSGNTYNELAEKTELPNDKGYSLYAQTIEKVIGSNITANKKTNIKSNVLYDDTNKLTNFVLDKSPDINNGFILEGVLTSKKKSDEITFNTTSEVAILNFLNQKNGGKFNVYVDGKFIHEVDTKSKSQCSNSILVADDLKGPHKILIRATSSVGGQTVKIVGIATN